MRKYLKWVVKEIGEKADRFGWVNSHVGIEQADRSG